MISPPLPDGIRRAIEAEGAGLTVIAVRLGAMGDIVRTLPAVRILRERLPAARFFWMLESQWRVVLDGHPDLAGLLPVPRREWTDHARNPLRWPRLVGGWREFRSRARIHGANLLLDFHGNLRSGLLARATSVAVRVGYDGHQQKEGNRLFTTHRVPSGSRRAPRMERNLDLVRALEIDVPRTLPPCGLPAVDAGAADAAAVLEVAGIGDGPFAVLSPGASAAQAYKKPPPGLLAAVCDRLAERGVHPLVVWGPGEQGDARAVVEAAAAATLAPPTRIPALLALLARARLFVGGDSGPLHLACAAGAPVLGIYGPTDPRVNQPWGVPFRAVHPPNRAYTGIKKIDRAAGGFDGLTPARVVEAVDALLEQTAL